MLRIFDGLDQQIGFGLRSKGLEEAAIPGALAAAAAGDGIRLAGEVLTGYGKPRKEGGVRQVQSGTKGCFAIVWQRAE